MTTESCVFPQMIGNGDVPTTRTRDATCENCTDLATQVSGPGSIERYQGETMQPMLKLLAAWDTLSAQLPPDMGASSDLGALLNALKLVLASAHEESITSALSLASELAAIARNGTTLDVNAIAAGIVREAFPAGHPGGRDIILERLGPEISVLYGDIVKTGSLPSRVDLYDDEAAAAIRELCLNFYDVRATAVEVIARLLRLKETFRSLEGEQIVKKNSTSGSSLTSTDITWQPTACSQVAALEALQIYAPLGHALGLTEVASKLEDLSLKLLFPASYVGTARWLKGRQEVAQRVLEHCSAVLKSATLSDPEFSKFAADINIFCRSKSTQSTLKKLLTLGNMQRGGRSRNDIHDLIAMRVVVKPREDLSQIEAEALSIRACYLVQSIAHELWHPKDGRTKDYIKNPKPNGYQSLHSTVDLTSSRMIDIPEDIATLELQVRTLSMHESAESGQAAHGAYKGGLDAVSARQLQAWTQLLLRESKSTLKATRSLSLPSKGSSRDSPEIVLAPPSDSDVDVSCPLDAAGIRGSFDAIDTELIEKPEALTRVGGSVASAAEALFRSLDLNRDGRVSLEELCVAARELGLTGAEQDAKALLALADADADGSLSLEEFLQFQKSVGQAAAASAMDECTATKLAGIDNMEHTLQHGSEVFLADDLDAQDNPVENIDRQASYDNDGCIEIGGSACARTQGTSKLTRSSAFQEPLQPHRRLVNPSGTLAAGGVLFSRSRICSRPLLKSSPSTPRCCIGSSNRFRLHAFIDRNQQGDYGSGDSSSSSLDETYFPPPKYSSQSSTTAVIRTKNGKQYGGDAGASKGERAASHADSLDRHDRLPSQSSAFARGTVEEESSARPLLKQKPNREDVQRRPQKNTFHELMRVFSRAAVDAEDATWELVPILPESWTYSPTLAENGDGTPFSENEGDEQNGRIVGLGKKQSTPDSRPAIWNAAGQRLTKDSLSLVVPQHGPSIFGAVLDRDCDFVLDVPTISAKHARLEMVKMGTGEGNAYVSKLVLMDLGSTNGTWVNRAKIVPFKEVPLYPGDIVCFAELQYAFEVRVASTSHASEDSSPSSSPSSSSPKVGHADATMPASSPDAVVDATGPALRAALKIAAALEASAAASGVFAPAYAADQEGVGDRARELTAQGEYQTAYMLLLGGVMAHPENPGLWAQLAAMDRQRARRRVQGSSMGTARAFYRAATELYEADANPSVRYEGLSRVFSSWAQMEYDMRNDISARILFQKSVRCARKHSSLVDLRNKDEGAAKILFTWASREWRLHDAPLAARLCRDALEEDPANVYALTLLGNISAATGDLETARCMFRRASKAKPMHVSALQSWARMEARTKGGMPTARQLFRKALHVEPENRYILQAWAVAEANIGRVEDARRLLRRCTTVDPVCVPAYHAWAKVEEKTGDTMAARELYEKVLQIRPTSVETWSALGRLERVMAKDLVAASNALEKALQIDGKHAPSLQELAEVRLLEGREAEAHQLKRKAKRINAEKSSLLSQAKRFVAKD